MKKILILLIFFQLLHTFMGAQATLTPRQIVEKADEKMRGKSSTAEIKMTIVRPAWKREMQMKSWSKGDELALILITAPARDKGVAFLKRNRELWNWQPSIDRVIKMPPSMMLQSWQGSDFTNDDLVKESSVIDDYTHKLLGSETVDDLDCYKIELIPMEDAAVVWGKVITWIDKKDFNQMKAEFYDEDGYLVNTMQARAVKMLGGKMVPSILEMIPAEHPDQKTVVEYLKLSFDIPVEDAFFSVQNLKKIN